MFTSAYIGTFLLRKAYILMNHIYDANKYYNFITDLYVEMFQLE